ncbi:MAG: hypothetical protein GY820_21075 [Gammaproteobacteria bacterium]|nr:hypothetical protein [Gammaproteobacteria bacterium]
MTGYHATDYYLRGTAVPVAPVIVGGGGSVGVTNDTYYNQTPSIYEYPKTGKPTMLAQALQEDEEFLIIISTAMKVLH